MSDIMILQNAVSILFLVLTMWGLTKLKAALRSFL